MRKALWIALIFSLSVTVASAQVFIGARCGGMGGTGVANATDLSAVYYNPAGLMKAGDFELKLSLNPSYTDYQDVLDAFNKSTNPADILQDNFAKSLSFQGDLAGMLGLNIHKIGISVVALPLGGAAADPLSGNNTIYIDKAAGALQGSATYAMRYDTILTLGYTFSLPTLSLDTGLNIKSINALYGTISAAAPQPSAPYISGTGNGMAFDLGVRTSLDVPVVGSLAVGLAMRDIAGQINYKREQQTWYFTGTITKGAESDLSDESVTLDSSTAIGAAATFPIINLSVAADIEMKKDDTITHLGLEYPLFPFVTARIGTATGSSVSKTTLGAKLNLFLFTLDAAAIMDGKDSSVMGWVVDIGTGF